MFNLLEAYVHERRGPQAWETVLAECRLRTPEPDLMVAPGTYEDDDFAEMVRVTAKMFGQSGDDFLFEVGRFMLPKLAERYQQLFAPYHHPGEFLKLNGMIHRTEIKKMYKDAEPPQFSCRELEPSHLILNYTSKRRYPSLVRGLLQGLADHYGVALTLEMTELPVHEGFFSWEFDLRFS